MNIRLYVINGKNEKMQIFGNNDFPDEFIDELRNQGLEFDDCFHEFKIHELQPLVDVVKQDFERRWMKYKKGKDFLKKINEYNGESIVDFTQNFINIVTKEYKCKSLYFNAYYILESGYMFILYNLIKFIMDDLDWINVHRMMIYLCLKKMLMLDFLCTNLS